jgi:hypothetical protein
MNVGEFAFSESLLEAEPAKDYATFHCTLKSNVVLLWRPLIVICSGSFMVSKGFQNYKATVWIAYFFAAPIPLLPVQ